MRGHASRSPTVLRPMGTSRDGSSRRQYLSKRNTETCHIDCCKYGAIRSFSSRSGKWCRDRRIRHPVCDPRQGARTVFEQPVPKAAVGSGLILAISRRGGRGNGDCHDDAIPRDRNCRGPGDRRQPAVLSRQTGSQTRRRVIRQRHRSATWARIDGDKTEERCCLIPGRALRSGPWRFTRVRSRSAITPSSKHDRMFLSHRLAKTVTPPSRSKASTS